MKKKILFLCTGNSCRSQMAEGILRSLYGDRYESFSAGTEPKPVHPRAIAALREIHIDISSHRSKPVEALPVKSFDVVVTVCDNARQSCPAFPGAARQIHWSIPDPAGAVGTPEEIEETFRSVREMLRRRIDTEFGPAT